MCFRPSPVKRSDPDQNVCATCGMPNGPDTDICEYCGDPIQADSTDNYSDIDPSYHTRII